MSPPLHARQIAERKGRRAETLAALWLRLKGYRIVARNLRTPPSEVDILAVRGGELILIEVKQRRSFAACEDSLNWATRRRLDRAAEWLYTNSPYADGRDLRIDTVLIAGARLRHVKAAWRVGE
jgi:putative endonuclease